ncbi:MAG: helix-turn-helix domain-containing protein [Chloroflexi bacterium]|nr:helix-turn-helix domain-containing protein [Chloroflexota bacterium]
MSDRLCATVRRLRTAPNGEPITGSEAHVLLILASITTDWTHEARIAVETIAADMRLSKRRVQQILETLVKKGAVERVGHSVGGRTTNGDGIPNRYRICIAAGAETAPEAAEEPDKGATQFTLTPEGCNFRGGKGAI